LQLCILLYACLSLGATSALLLLLLLLTKAAPSHPTDVASYIDKMQTELNRLL